MNWTKYLVEFIGSFFIVSTVGMTIIRPGDAGNLAPLAIGSVLMVMVYAGRHVSGAHYNPAVTLAMFVRGKCPMADVMPYMVMQILGAVAASYLVMFIKSFPPMTPAVIDNPAKVLLVEFVFTFAFCYVFLNVTTSEATAGNSYFGLAIGFTVTAGMYAVGPVSIGVFNPAVAVGIAILGVTLQINLWIYVAASLAAAIVAAISFKLINSGNQTDTS
jgi:aquaporin Z